MEPKRPPVLKMILNLVAINSIALALGASVAMGLRNPIFVKIFGAAGLSVSIRQITRLT